ncbi:unnamed protein product [Protopolystoma xenopodis]|uniref:Uncharacterized protein n=1 Tax=Protopolystoma xenopodis TaxID=117903 RepID=A0A3S5CLR1_9PLAT|nr:unnamed protein product [Protopolystoma xenopodis]
MDIALVSSIADFAEPPLWDLFFVWNSTKNGALPGRFPTYNDSLRLTTISHSPTCLHTLGNSFQSISSTFVASHAPDSYRHMLLKSGFVLSTCPVNEKHISTRPSLLFAQQKPFGRAESAIRQEEKKNKPPTPSLPATQPASQPARHTYRQTDRQTSILPDSVLSAGRQPDDSRKRSMGNYCTEGIGSDYLGHVFFSPSDLTIPPEAEFKQTSK